MSNLVTMFKGLVFAGVLALCYFPLFLHLDSLSLRLWDESRRAVNALEMLDNGNWLIPHYNGAPDMWGTKPPLLVWFQALSMRALGYNELAVRLPSALAGVATVLLLIWFCGRQLGRLPLGYFAALALLTMPGYITQAHSARTGDFDALLTLWMTSTLLFLFLFLEETEEGRRRRYLWLMTGAMVLAGLTKGVASLFLLPGMFLYLLIRRAVPAVLSRRDTWYAVAAYLLIVPGYYVLREQLNPGYIDAIWGNELTGRYIEGREGYHFGFWFYFNNLWQDRMAYWVWFVPVGLALGWTAGGRLRDLSLLLGLSSLLLLLVISFSKTKMVWYELPAYPSMAVLAAIPLMFALESDLSKLAFRKPWSRYVFTVFFLFLFLAIPYRRAISEVYLISDTGHQSEKTQYSHFIERHPQLKGYEIGIDEYNAHADFYTKVYNKRGYGLRINKLKKRLSPGTQVLICDPIFRDSLFKLHSPEELEVLEEGRCTLFRVVEK